MLNTHVPKDWTGNTRTTFVTLGASNHTTKQREQHDFYATDPCSVDGLLSCITLPQRVWECACGAGHLSSRLVELGYDVYSSDLIDRGYGDVQDFLQATTLPAGCRCILTNPPYRYASLFVKKALSLLPKGGAAIFFLKTTFLEGCKRYEEIFSVTPPKHIYQFPRRVLCAKNGDFERMKRGGGSAVAYAWYVWEKGYTGYTQLHWINPNTYEKTI